MKLLPEQRLPRLEEIHDEIRNLSLEAINLVGLLDPTKKERARKTWYAHIRMALDSDHGFLGSTVRTLQEEIEGFYPEPEEDPIEEKEP